MPELYVGLISGTSTDGVDAALVDFEGSRPRLIKALNHPYPAELRARVERLITPQWRGTLTEVGQVHAALGRVFADAVLRILKEADATPAAVAAIGSHGQTVCHAPQGEDRFTLQLGDPNRIATFTGITTVADFRGKDMALGGQGAPLVPAFHATLLHSSTEDRVVVNLGGIANLTLLPADQDRPALGFDTGPANTLMDGWIGRHKHQDFDRNGSWASSGRPDTALLERLLAEPYFALPAPKSTGRELFNQAWLDGHLLAHGQHIAPQDVQATLLELTARSIATAVESCELPPGRLIACGGGTHNAALMDRLGELLAPCPVQTTDEFGIPADWMEAMAFAWLARQTLTKRPGNLPSATGAQRAAVLGAIYAAD